MHWCPGNLATPDKSFIINDVLPPEAHLHSIVVPCQRVAFAIGYLHGS